MANSSSTRVTPTRPRRSSRRFTKGVVDAADLKVVFQHFEATEDGLMGYEPFKVLVGDLRLNLREHEVKRLFRHLCAEKTLAQTAAEDDDCASVSTLEDEPHVLGGTAAGDLTCRINAEQFLAGIRRHRFLRRIVSLYTFNDPRSWSVPRDYDYSKPTHENYGRAPSSSSSSSDKEKVGSLVEIRRRLDESWHGSYVAERQLWQDAVVLAIALPDDDVVETTTNFLARRPKAVVSNAKKNPQNGSYYYGSRFPCYPPDKEEEDAPLGAPPAAPVAAVASGHHGIAHALEKNPTLTTTKEDGAAASSRMPTQQQQQEQPKLKRTRSMLPSSRPWLVFTCGAMGAGKGYVMNWMSIRDILPLKEVVVHIDPDRFKQMMPEWPEYVRRDKLAAGSMCHKESGFIAELAQELAMDQSLNVWVDGSLRDFEWHAQKIREIRRRHPQYRIALFYVHATEATVRRRVKTRAARLGGRDVPEDVLADSLGAPAKTLQALTPMVDFVARIRNEDEPVLEAMETIDTSGNWHRIAEMFGVRGGGDEYFFGGDNSSRSSLNRRHRAFSSFASMPSSDHLDILSSTPQSPSSVAPPVMGPHSYGAPGTRPGGLAAMFANNGEPRASDASSDLQQRPSSEHQRGVGEHPSSSSRLGGAEDVGDLLNRCRRESRLLRSRCDDDAKTIAYLTAEVTTLRQQVQVLSAMAVEANARSQNNGRTKSAESNAPPASPLAAAKLFSCFRRPPSRGERMPRSPSEETTRCSFFLGGTD
eukprot:CAMPEP_0118898530 /NCGR_PEP_ID=MMETSP1166-20130328/5479_1 /TAXON_ID=1104430 /ORGANISM="Chrysoreinhardia sp, Strain CCMP3193" /LENGTH=757 /DNA_ID=CAMNT_0006837639 /DNA_START=252 /DNA_END=2525 /DNA_ORIENTATION=+